MLAYSRAIRTQLPALARSSRYAITNVCATSIRLQHAAPAQPIEISDIKNEKVRTSQNSNSKQEYRKHRAEVEAKLLQQINSLTGEIDVQRKAGASSNQLVDSFFSKVNSLPKNGSRRIMKELLKGSILSIMEKATTEANDPNQQRVPASPQNILNKAIYQEVAHPALFSYVASELLKEGDYSGVMSLWVTYLESEVNSTESLRNAQQFQQLVTLAYLESCTVTKTQPQLEKLLQLLQVKKLPKVNYMRTLLSSIIPHSSERFKPLNDALDSLFFYSRNPNDISAISAALEAADFGEAYAVHRTWNDVRKASSLNGIKITEDTMVAFMKMFNTLNLPRESQSIWNTLLSSGISPSTDAWNVLLVTVSKLGPKAKRLGQVEYVKEKIPNPNTQTTVTLMKLYTQFQKYDKVEELSRGQLNVPVISQGYLQSLATRGDFSKVKEFVDKLKSEKIELSQQSYNNILASALRQGLYDQIPKYVQEMKAAGVKRDIATYTIMMDYNLKSLAAKGEIPTDYAFELFFQELEQNGMKPNKFTFTAIMDNLAKAGSVETAQHLFRFLQSRKMASQVSYISLITSEFEAGLVHEAEAHFNEFRTTFTASASHWSALFKGLIINGETQKALGYLRLLENKPQLVNRFSLYFLLSGARSKRDTELAEEVLEFINKSQLESAVTSQTVSVIQDLDNRGVQIPESIRAML
jgi:hypothetical protein